MLNQWLQQSSGILFNQQQVVKSNVFNGVQGRKQLEQLIKKTAACPKNDWVASEELWIGIQMREMMARVGTVDGARKIKFELLQQWHRIVIEEREKRREHHEELVQPIEVKRWPQAECTKIVSNALQAAFGLFVIELALISLMHRETSAAQCALAELELGPDSRAPKAHRMPAAAHETRRCAFAQRE